MDEENRQPKRLIIPQRNNSRAAQTVTRVNSVSSLLDGALATLAEQLDKLAIKSRFAEFDEKEAKVLQGYIRSLVELSKEQREHEKADKMPEDLAKLTNEELLELANAKLVEQKKQNS